MSEDTGAPAKTRYSIDLDESHRSALAGIAKTYKITQGEVIEVLLDRMILDNEVGIALTAKREAKVARRAPNKELYKQFKNLTPPQIAAALAAAQALEAEKAS